MELSNEVKNILVEIDIRIADFILRTTWTNENGEKDTIKFLTKKMNFDIWLDECKKNLNDLEKLAIDIKMFQIKSSMKFFLNFPK